jgi:glycosyltransferase involved in cell wall biosynthesis
MTTLWIALAAFTFAFLAGGCALLVWSQTRIGALADVPRLVAAERTPRVSVIAPALNEERNVEAAVRSLCSQDYADYEVILVDDRSTDATPAILSRLARELPRLGVVTVRELPPGWLGKNHACWQGARAASGEILVFTDADVVFAPSALERAVAHLERNGLDHLTVAPETVMPGLVNQFTLYFGLLFTLYVRPWAARNPRSRAHVGIGAFNMVRAAAYRAVGGHEPIRLRPDDDLKLGKLVKLHGFAQDFLVGRGMITVEWYASWRQVRDGLMKNLYAGAEYRTWLVALGVLAHVLVLAMPPFALLWTSGAAWWLYLACMGVYVAQGAIAARGFGTAWWAGVLLPFLALFGAYLMVRATWLTLRNDGIDWRGTHYALADLRANVV